MMENFKIVFLVINYVAKIQKSAQVCKGNDIFLLQISFSTPLTPLFFRKAHKYWAEASGVGWAEPHFQSHFQPHFLGNKRRAMGNVNFVGRWGQKWGHRWG